MNLLYPLSSDNNLFAHVSVISQYCNTGLEDNTQGEPNVNVGCHCWGKSRYKINDCANKFSNVKYYNQRMNINKVWIKFILN